MFGPEYFDLVAIGDGCGIYCLECASKTYELDFANMSWSALQEWVSQQANKGVYLVVDAEAPAFAPDGYTCDECGATIFESDIRIEYDDDSEHYDVWVYDEHVGSFDTYARAQSEAEAAL